MIRRAVMVAAAVGAAGIALLGFAPAAPASPQGAPAAPAHPLGNFTINHHTTLRPSTGLLTVDWALDLAEIATVQNYPDIETDGDATVSTEEAAAWVEPLADGLHLAVDGTSVPLSLESAAASEAAGQGGLTILRVEATFTAPLPDDGEAGVTYGDDTFRTHLGWREIIVIAGPGATVLDADVPGESVSDALRAYPEDRLGTPPDVRTASLAVALDPSAAAYASSSGEASPPTPREGSRWSFTELARLDLGVWTLLGALGVAVVWGSLHALAPGHGKTLMAAYLVGSRARRRDTLLLAGTVAVAHTAGVLILGVVVLAASSAFAPETAYPWLTFASGVMLAAIGLVLTVRRLSGGRHEHTHSHADHGAAHGHTRAHHHPPAPGQPAGDGTAAAPGQVAVLEEAHGHEHIHDAAGAEVHVNEHAEPHPRGHEAAAGESGGWRTFAAGIAVGLVPSPTALVVFLSASAIGRTAFGIVLVAAFGLGLTATLFLLGAAVGGLTSRLQTTRLRDSKAVRYLPAVGAVAVLAAGTWLALRGLLDLS